jgi:hypothetical protein
MSFKVKTLALVAGLIVALSGTGFAAKKNGDKHVAVGTITSIDNNQVVINEKVKGKEQPMTFKLDSSTKRNGNLTTGKMVRIHYRSQNHQNVATAINERGIKHAKKG